MNLYAKRILVLVMGWGFILLGIVVALGIRIAGTCSGSMVVPQWHQPG